MRHDKLFWPIFRRTAAAFLAFWLVMALVLSYLNFNRLETDAAARIDDARRQAETEYQRVWEGTASEAEKPAILANHLAFNSLYDLGGICLTRVYDDSGDELARSQITQGSVTPMGTGVFSQFLHFDEVLTDEEQLALAQRLRDERTLGYFFGTAGGLYEDVEAPGLYGEVTGIAAGNVIYPQKLVYYYDTGDAPVTVMESGSALFEGAELTTFRFDSARITSQLVDTGATPKQRLGHYRRADATLDRMVAESRPSPQSGGTYRYDGYGANQGGMSGGVLVGSAYSYSRLVLATHTLGPTYVLTLLAALMMAIFVSTAQARALRREQDLTRAVAHELKTPLAVLRSHAEALSEDIDPAKREQYLNIIMDESDRMAALVMELLDLSRMEAGCEKLNREEVDLKTLTERVFAPLSGLAPVQLNLEPLTVSGDGKRLERAVSNYASNALGHLAPGGEIRVALTRTGGKAVLTVENDGAPIPLEAMPHIWETFYKADTARTRGSGTGLGLAIVREVAALHGGGVGAENIPGGVRFTLSLPCNITPAVVV